jgi:hypothetical protein
MNLGEPPPSPHQCFSAKSLVLQTLLHVTIRPKDGSKNSLSQPVLSRRELAKIFAGCRYTFQHLTDAVLPKCARTKLNVCFQPFLRSRRPL